MARQTQGFYAAKPQDTTFTADWYQKNMPSDVAENQSGALGISKDQLYQMYSAYAQANPGQRATWEPSYANQGVGAGGTVQSPPPAWGWMQQQVATQKAQQVLNPQQPQQAAAAQPQMPQLGPTQPVSQIPITPLTPTAQFGATTQAAPSMNVPQASAQGATPLFSLGSGQNWMLPQAQVQPPQPYAAAMQATPGLQPYQPVQKFQAGGPVTSPDPGWARLGLGGLTQDQINQLGGSPTAAGAQYAPYFLGAAALNMPAVINLPPSGTPSSKSGVAPTPGAVIGTDVPQGGQMTWLDVGQAAGLSANDIAAFQQQGLTPVQVAQKFNVGSPWQTQPGVFAKAPMPTVGKTAPGWTGNLQMPLTAQVPANAAQMPQMPITPAASASGAVPQMTLASGAGQPPAAPGAAMQAGMPTSFMAAHTSALADAGRALFAHFGGDPNFAGPGDIANFHTKLTGMIGQLSKGSTTAAAGPTGPKKMQSGGLVTQQQPQVQGFADGGSISGPEGAPAGYYFNPATGDYQPLQTEGTVLPPITVTGTPPQRPRQISTTQQQATRPQQQPTATQMTQPQPQYYQSFGYGSGYPGSFQTPVGIQQPSPQSPSRNYTFGPSPGPGQVGPVTGGGGMTVGQLGSGPMPGAGQTVSLGKAPGGSGIGNAISGLASGIAQAAQTYANSIKPWQMQASAIPNPDDFRRNQQQISLQEPRVV